MKNFILALSLFAFAFSASAQTALVQTTLSSPIGKGADQFITVTSATGITAGTFLLVEKEAMLVLAVSGTQLQVARGQDTTKAVGHPTLAMVLSGPPANFFDTDPTGSCTASQTVATPYVNVQTGLQWLCSSITGGWTVGWQNPTLPPRVTTAVASVAGQVTPSGPLFHITGTAAIIGFNIPVGFAYGSFCVIPDGAFTTTTANNIAAASTAVLNVLDCWTWDDKNSKFVPTY